PTDGFERNGAGKIRIRKKSEVKNQRLKARITVCSFTPRINACPDTIRTSAATASRWPSAHVTESDCMLFVLDVGNTNTVLGVFARVAKVHPGGDADESPRYERLLANWRVATSRTSTVDEYGVLFRNLFSMAGLEARGIHGIVVSSVVPPLDPV